MATIVYDFTKDCTAAPDNAGIEDLNVSQVVWDIVEAVECLFCCCCSGSGTGSGTGSGSGAPCCQTYGYDLNPTDVALDVYLGYNYSNSFVMCLPEGGTVTTQLTLTNQDSMPLRVSTGTLYFGYSDPCSLVAESFVYNNLEVDLPVGTPVVAGEGIGSDLQPCCSYFMLFIIVTQDPAAKSFMAKPVYDDLVDSGVESDKGSSGIEGPGCRCFCEHPPEPAKASISVKPVLPDAEIGWVVDHAFLNLGGEPNCKYMWNLHVRHDGQGESCVFARDRCGVIDVDKRNRDVKGTDSSPPVAEFDYQLMVCGPAVLGIQLRNYVADRIAHPGQVNVTAELAECYWGYNHVCCCGPYPPCLEEQVSDPRVSYAEQKDGLPAGWIVDGEKGFILAGAKGPEGAVAGLSYTVDGDPSCAYKVRLELDAKLSPTCLLTFMGGDYAAFAVGQDGMGSLYTDLWVCGGTTFALLLSGHGGRAEFRVKYLGEYNVQTPICCT